MSISPVSVAGASLAPLPAPASTPSPSGTGFQSIVDHVFGKAAQQHVEAENALHDLILGNTDNLHGVLLQIAQADLSFRTILEIRNRISDAFQEIMKMQI
jgi:flagellar hook-basal body complex protein FliE